VRVNLDNLKKQAKLLVRWHREGNHSVGGRIRQLHRYRELTDQQILSLKFPLTEAQEIVALEAGYPGWAGLRAGLDAAANNAKPAAAAPAIKQTIPVVFVSDVPVSAGFYRDKLGFKIDFLHGNPPFYGSVSRDRACIHLRFVPEPAFAADLREREALLSAFVTVENAKGLFAEFSAAKVAFVQRLKKEPWGGPGFIVRDPDGNWICFSE
jgi:catechol 2,3-dioxygenase-like lactoylglutathione lyase family enzyme